MNTLNQFNKNGKIILYSFMRKFTQINSNIGLRGKGPNSSFFPFKFSAQGPSPRRNGRVDYLLATSLISNMFPCTTHTSRSISLQRSHLFFLSLSLSAIHPHTPTKISQILSRSLKNSPSSPLKNLEFQEAFKRKFPQNSSSKVRLCLDL